MTHRADGNPSRCDDRSPGREEPLLLAGLVAMAGASCLMLALQAAVPDSVRFGCVTIDRLSATLTLLVASVGAVAFRFSQRYLDGEPGRRRFLRWLSFTVASAYVLMLATNVLLLYVAWSLTSIGLHRLLVHGGDHPEQTRPARKKFLISRLGDLALVGAIVLIWRGWGTFDLHEFLPAVADPAEARTIALLVVVAALTKSAQFPFHSWLPETMEAPTPVSALMHAGIINAGGALLLRFAPLLVRVPEALFLLALVGTLTAFVGMLAMWAQVKVKRTLAWSTVSQMGFMMVQCGLAAFPAAALHMVGHGCYKAWSFLRSGEVPAPSVRSAQASPTRVLGLVLLGIGVSLPAIALSAWATGFAPLHSPGELALSAIVAMSVGQVWAALLAGRGRGWPDATSILVAVAATPVAVFAAFAIYRGAGDFLTPVLGELPAPSGLLAWVAAALPVGALALLALIHATLPLACRTATGRAFHVHALHGFYFGAIADRFVNLIWNSFAPREKEVTRA